MKRKFEWYGLKWEKTMTVSEFETEQKNMMKIIAVAWFTLFIFGIFWFAMIMQVLGYKLG